MSLEFICYEDFLPQQQIRMIVLVIIVITSTPSLPFGDDEQVEIESHYLFEDRKRHQCVHVVFMI